MSGKQLFNKKTIEGFDGNKYTLEFNFYSLARLEEVAGGKFENVFDLFGEKEEDFKSGSIHLLLWACLVEHQEEFDEFDTDKKAKRSVRHIVHGSNFREVTQATTDLFRTFWKEETAEDKRKKK